MSNVADLKTQLVTDANTLSDTVDRLECLSDIDDWYTCRVAVSELSAHDVQSYSVSGRSFTKKDLKSLEARERDLYAKIKARLYCAGSMLADSRYPT